MASNIQKYGKKPIQKILRTPPSRFINLPDYKFIENYVIIYEETNNEKVSLRMHFIDEGPKNAKETILLMHGEPTWSYLYRKFIPILTKKGYRVVVPDLIGFGKSDKPSQQEDYSYARWIKWMNQFLIQINLQNITLFCQDWGGLIGLRVVQQNPEKFSRIAIANTTLPLPNKLMKNNYFHRWANDVSQNMKSWGTLLNKSSTKGLNQEEQAAYEAPFPTEEYKAASRVAPKLVPITNEHQEVEENKKAIDFFSKWEKPFITLFSDKDPIFGNKGVEVFWQKLVPGAKNQKHTIIKNAGHFLQEDQPEEICSHLIEFIEQNQVQQQFTPKL
ncbi:hypothetical protein PPERSA_01362 [Pseudocohnilembus persalinus]|uniref:AB hydrolase-1 domain-containing protein n=1 Tax=Pseudocohnilembus persalinus TaxID=266149 RepID=A0A0V0QGQ6_PSEPJ|nr:hypothetical protein PPERSA_01362 [Pseudocohnilembus persalinus]|eukprot:KRX01459.1 hypothetical protein PPERSA_01362 [Pseudocohnilembus persalinus]